MSAARAPERASAIISPQNLQNTTKLNLPWPMTVTMTVTTCLPTSMNVPDNVPSILQFTWWNAPQNSAKGAAFWASALYLLCMQSRFTVQLLATLWILAHQASLSMGFSRQESWSGLPCPPLGDLLDPGIQNCASHSFCIAGGLFTSEPPGNW